MFQNTKVQVRYVAFHTYQKYGINGMKKSTHINKIYVNIRKHTEMKK